MNQGSIAKKALSVLLAGSLLLGEAASMTALPVYADDAKNTEGKAKYISDVFIAYGRTEKEAKDWLVNNNWEPISGNCDFNAGKASQDGENVAAVMGIRRTDKVENAITDMSAMNMQGGYRFSDYENLIEQKNAEIDQFIDNFLPAIDEYRANYNGEGSDFGDERASIAHDILNKFYDGGEKEEYPKNDTGEELGDLLLEELIQEGGRQR